VNVIGVAPVVALVTAVKVLPRRAVPEMETAAVSGGTTTAEVAAEVALLEPAELVATTLTRITRPTSPATGVYVEAVAPGMFVKVSTAEAALAH
jgi:hypothetical protein